MNIKSMSIQKNELVWFKYLKNNIGILIGLIAICVFLSITTDKFLTAENIMIVLRQVSINAIIALGMTYVILLGGIDLSVGSIIAFCGIITTVMISRFNIPLGISIVIGLVSGVIVGLINGLIIAKAKLPSFILTLATSYMARGFAYIISDGKPIPIKVEGFSDIGNGYLGPIPYPIIYMLIMFTAFSYILYRTRFGKNIYAIGGNMEAAKYSAIRTDRVQIAAYTLLGFLAAFGGIVQSSRLYSGQPTIGQNAELDAIAAVILGGTSFTGGIGTLGGSMIGAIVIGIINNGLNLLGVSSFWQMVAKGIVIILAVYVDMLKKNSKRG